MKQIKFLPVLFLIFMPLFISCAKDDENEKTKPSDSLDKIGIIADWSLQSRTINGATDMSIKNAIIKFIPDNKIDDLKGNFRREEGSFIAKGQFEIKPAINIINFDLSNVQKAYEFHISDDTMTFTYSEGNLEIIEDWKKEN